MPGSLDPDEQAWEESSEKSRKQTSKTLPTLVAELEGGKPCPVCRQLVPGTTLGDLRNGAEPPAKVAHDASCAAYRPAYRCPDCMRQEILRLEEVLKEVARQIRILSSGLRG